MSEALLAKDLMTSPVKTLAHDTSVVEAAKLLLRWKISGAPVVDASGRLLGVFTLRDLARYVQGRLVELPVVDRRRERILETREPVPPDYHFEGFEQSTVADLMTLGVASVFPESTFEEVARSMCSLGIHRVFVLTEAGKLEGVITTMDVLRWIDRGFLARKGMGQKQTG